MLLDLPHIEPTIDIPVFGAFRELVGDYLAILRVSGCDVLGKGWTEVDPQVLELAHVSLAQHRVAEEHELLARGGSQVVSQLVACHVRPFISSLAALAVEEHAVDLIAVVILPVLQILAVAMLESKRDGSLQPLPEIDVEEIPSENLLQELVDLFPVQEPGLLPLRIFVVSLLHQSLLLKVVAVPVLSMAILLAFRIGSRVDQIHFLSLLAVSVIHERLQELVLLFLLLGLSLLLEPLALGLRFLVLLLAQLVLLPVQLLLLQSEEHLSLGVDPIAFGRASKEGWTKTAQAKLLGLQHLESLRVSTFAQRVIYLRLTAGR